MRTTLDIPDSLYRRIRVRTAREGNTVRGLTLVLYAKWLDGETSAPAAHASRRAKKPTPPWFGSVKVDPSLPHDMKSVRRSIAKRLGE